MSSRDLFGVYAQIVGMSIYYDLDMLSDGWGGTLEIQPRWSKTPQKDGYVLIRVDEDTQDVVPELIREAWDGIHTADPAYYVPRWVKDHLQDYERASH